MRRSTLLVLLTTVALMSSLLAQTAQSPAPPPWTLSETQIREIVGRVRAGQDLSPKSWPDSGRVAVGLSFDLDNETGTLRDNGTSPALFS